MQTFTKKIWTLLESWIPEVDLGPWQTSMKELRYLKRSRSRSLSRKQFTLLNYTVYLSPYESFEPFFKPNGDLRLQNDVYS